MKRYAVQTILTATDIFIYRKFFFTWCREYLFDATIPSFPSGHCYSIYKKRYAEIISGRSKRYTDVYRSPKKLLMVIYSLVCICLFTRGGVSYRARAFPDTFKLHRLGNNCRGTSLSRFGIRLKFLHVFQ